MRVVLQVGTGEEVLRQHRRLVRRERLQHVRSRILQAEDRCLCIGRVDRHHFLEARRPSGVHLLQHFHDRVLHVGTREWLAVVEADPVLQVERDGLAIRAHVPRLREARHRIQVEVVFEQPVVHLRRHLSDGPRSVVVRSEGRRLRLHHHHQCAALSGGPCGRLARRPCGFESDAGQPGREPEHPGCLHESAPADREVLVLHEIRDDLDGILFGTVSHWCLLQNCDS